MLLTASLGSKSRLIAPGFRTMYNDGEPPFFIMLDIRRKPDAGITDPQWFLFSIYYIMNLSDVKSFSSSIGTAKALLGAIQYGIFYYSGDAIKKCHTGWRQAGL